MPLRTTTRVATRPATSTEVAVLGLLTGGEQSGYDLLRSAERSVGFFWTPAKTQLYAILKKLVDHGYATARHVRQTDRPDKTLYTITEAGHERLRDGLERAGTEVNRNPLDLRIFFGAHRPVENVIADLEAVRDQCRAHLAELEHIEGTFDHDEYFFEYLTLLHGKADAEGRARWADEALRLIERRRR